MSKNIRFIPLNGGLVNVNAISCIYPDGDDHVKIFFTGDDAAAGCVRFRGSFSDIEQKLTELEEKNNEI